MPRPKYGPFAGDEIGPYTVVEERPSVPKRVAPGNMGKERTFLVRCRCGATDVIKRNILTIIASRGARGCKACSGRNMRDTYPVRWPDGIYGTWQLTGRVRCRGIAGWSMTCRTCGATRVQDGLREERANIPCAKCERRKFKEAQIRGRAARLGRTIVRLELT